MQSALPVEGSRRQGLPWLQSHIPKELIVAEVELPAPLMPLEEYEVVLHIVDGRKLGLGLQYVVHEKDGRKDLSRIQVADVMEGEAAWCCKEIETGDVLLEVNEREVDGLSFGAVTELFKLSPEHVHLRLQRSARASASRAQALQEQDREMQTEAAALRAQEVAKPSAVDLAVVVAKELELEDPHGDGLSFEFQVVAQLAASFVAEAEEDATLDTTARKMDLSVIDTSTLLRAASMQLEGAGLEAQYVVSMAQAILPLRMALSARDWPRVNEIVQQKDVAFSAEAVRAQKEVRGVQSVALTSSTSPNFLVSAVRGKRSAAEGDGHTDAGFQY
jgi:hypothetical protein